MSLLASSLSNMLFLIALLFVYVIFSLSLTSPKETDHISKLVKLPGLSLSTSYFGNRILEYKIDNNIVYFGAAQDTYADFLYAK